MESVYKFDNQSNSWSIPIITSSGLSLKNYRGGYGEYVADYNGKTYCHNYYINDMIIIDTRIYLLTILTVNV